MSSAALVQPRPVNRSGEEIAMRALIVSELRKANIDACCDEVAL